MKLTIYSKVGNEFVTTTSVVSDDFPIAAKTLTDVMNAEGSTAILAWIENDNPDAPMFMSDGPRWNRATPNCR